MMSLFEVFLLIVFTWAGVRLWFGTTSNTARAVSLLSLLLLAWGVLAP